MTIISLFATLLWVGAAQAKPSATLTCQQSKLAADGQLEHCLAQNRANILAGGTDSSATCFANFNAQLANADAIALKAGASCRYVDNGDGTVSDLNTVLMWEQTTGTIGGTNTGNITDVNNTYTWSSNGTATAPDGPAFTSFLGTLNNGSTIGVSFPITGCFANHCDWRLPSIVEQKGIVDASGPGCATQSGPGPCIDPIFGPTQSDFYWSATTLAGDPSEAWDVLFRDGGPGFDSKVGFHYVRAVRSGL